MDKYDEMKKKSKDEKVMTHALKLEEDPEAEERRKKFLRGQERKTQSELEAKLSELKLKYK